MKYIPRLAVLFIISAYVIISIGCKGSYTYHPYQTFESDRWQKFMQMYPQPEETLNQVHLIRYYKNAEAQRNNVVQELGFANQIRIVVPIKKYDEKYNIPETNSKVNFHDPDSYIHTRVENGEVVKYDAVDKYIWEITDLEGMPKGLINELGSIYKWIPQKNTMTFVGIGSLRNAVLNLFDISWNVYEQENDDNTFTIRGIAIDDQPIVDLKPLLTDELQSRFYNTAKEFDRSIYVDTLLDEYKLSKNLKIYESKKNADDEFADDDDDDDDDEFADDDDDDDDDEFADDDDDDDDDDEWE